MVRFTEKTSRYWIASIIQHRPMTRLLQSTPPSISIDRARCRLIPICRHAVKPMASPHCADWLIEDVPPIMSPLTGEFARALQRGLRPTVIVFSGVGETPRRDRRRTQSRRKASSRKRELNLQKRFKSPASLRRSRWWANLDRRSKTYPAIATGPKESKPGLRLDKAPGTLRIVKSPLVGF
jgi:diaminopimelate decarboxylase